MLLTTSGVAGGTKSESETPVETDVAVMVVRDADAPVPEEVCKKRMAPLEP